MTWVIGRGGRVIYKGAWTSAAMIEGLLDRYLGIRKGRTSGVPLAPFGTEQIEFHEVDRTFWYERLRRNGERSVQDWDAAQAWLSEAGRTSADEGA